MSEPIIGTEQAEAYMRSAIRSANALRVELGRALPGPLTVSPHVALLGGVIAIYISDKQAEHLADMVRRAGQLEAPSPDSKTTETRN